jgi:signal transduction histidine kinase
MNVSKRSLGEAYIVATGVVLAAVLGGEIINDGTASPFWVITSGLSVFVLVGAVYWLHRLEFDAEEVWLVANCSAVGLGVGTTALVFTEVMTTASVGSRVGSAAVGTGLAATAVIGALTGVVCILERSSRKLRDQNTVLHRILRHNLRNDMTVVLCMLDDIESTADQETAAKARHASDKVRSVVRLTDSVRQANVSVSDPTTGHCRRNLSTLVESRVADLDTTSRDLTIGTDMPEEAFVSVGEEFGLVVDNIVESALSGDGEPSTLRVRIQTDPQTVTLTVEDPGKAIPRADISAVTSGTETALEHGLGVELWLVEWLVDANDGDVRFEADDDGQRVVIELDRAGSKWLG